MVDKIGDKKLRGVKPTSGTERVDDPQAISSVGGVKPAGRVGEASGVGALNRRRLTREMTAEEREKLFKMINEEANKILSGVSAKKKEIVADAVKMAIDGGLLPKEEQNDSKKKVRS